ncbi:MAG: hypothetical protein JWL73_3272 [Actinomycetia bacterium]|nr:hypothetical protein [Actinomycetes bacterium]
MRSIEGVIQGSTVFVEFSGGCDSSLVLATATDVCRRLGAPDPVPLTYRFSGADGSDEQEYQELVVRSLGLRDWEIVDFGSDGDCLGPGAQASLHTTGLVWPATLHFRAGVYAGLGPGLLLTGEGGDEVLGLRRSSWLAEAARYVLRGRRVPPRGTTRQAMRSLAPHALRRRWATNEIDAAYGADWLHADLRRDLVARAAALAAEEPLSAADWGPYHLSMPRVWIGDHNVRAFAAAHGLRYEAPLMAPDFLAAVADQVPWWEFRGRDILLRHHFADVLPAAILERRTKSVFNEAYFGRHTRAFAARWDGTGLPEGVDARWLKDHWAGTGAIHAGTSMLLHQAWLATEARA